MGIKQKIEDHAVIIFGAALVTGFAAGFITYEKILYAGGKITVPITHHEQYKNTVIEYEDFKRKKIVIKEQLTQLQDENKRLREQVQSLAAHKPTEAIQASNPDKEVMPQPEKPSHQQVNLHKPSQEIKKIEISFLKTERAGTDLVVHLRFLNKGTEDQKYSFFGKGEYFGGSNLFAEAKEYDATTIAIGNKESKTFLYYNFPAGIPVDGRLIFNRFPLEHKTINVILAHSEQYAKPQGGLKFEKISL